MTSSTESCSAAAICSTVSTFISSRFFVAIIDENSNIVSVNTDKIFAISENEAKDITISLFDKNEKLAVIGKGLLNDIMRIKKYID